MQQSMHMACKKQLSTNKTTQDGNNWHTNKLLSSDCCWWDAASDIDHRRRAGMISIVTACLKDFYSYAEEVSIYQQMTQHVLCLTKICSICQKFLYNWCSLIFHDQLMFALTSPDANPAPQPLGVASLLIKTSIGFVGNRLLWHVVTIVNFREGWHLCIRRGSPRVGQSWWCKRSLEKR